MAKVEGLLAGFQNFRDSWSGGHDTLFAALRQGQKPKAVIVACSDSRVDPALLLGFGFGDVFMIRNVANLIPPAGCDREGDSTMAAISYGLNHLGIRDIVVLGHSHCGGIRAACALWDAPGEDSPQAGAGDSFLVSWLELVRPALELVRNEMPDLAGNDFASECEKASTLLQLENLLSHAWLKAAWEKGCLELHPWFFDMEHGDLLRLAARGEELLEHRNDF